MKILVTGSAGFIGFHLCKLLLREGHEVFGIDCFTPYYDPKLKDARHGILVSLNGFGSAKVRLEDSEAIGEIFDRFQPQVVVHLAAQAGVRYSIDNPAEYVDSNLIGTCRLLEVSRERGLKHFLFASTSSVYGASKDLPYKENIKTESPLSFYAATKKSGEVITHSYAHLFKIPVTCFRFFTVYGPWGRPDMALFKFTRAMLAKKPIDIFNHGEMYRDFTYVDDLVAAISKLIEITPEEGKPAGVIDSLSETAPWRVVNIGNSSSERLLDFIEILEGELGVQSNKRFLPLQAGDVEKTWADCSLLKLLTDYKPNTPIQKGIPKFIAWYRDYYEIKQDS